MVLSRAFQATEKLKAALSAEVERAKNEGKLLKTLDAPTLMRGATLREQFNVTVQVLERELQSELALVARELGLTEVTFAALSVALPEGKALAAMMGEVKSLARMLSALDEQNRVLTERTLTIVRAYVSALAPKPTGYTRHGVAPPPTAGTFHSARI